MSNRIKWFFRLQLLSWKRLFRLGKEYPKTGVSTADWHLPLNPELNPDHPSTHCVCDQTHTNDASLAFDPQTNHLYDCTWAKVMCRTCMGDGVCRACFGDGIAPSLIDQPDRCIENHTQYERCVGCADVSYLRCERCVATLPRLCGMHRFPPNPDPADKSR